MGCGVVNIASISYVCDDIPTGGMVKLFLAAKDKTHATIDENGNVTDLYFDYFNRPVEIGFDYRDGYSNFVDAETTENNTVSVNKPVINVQIPIMNAAHRNALDGLVNYRDNLVAFIESAAGTKHMVGYNRGLNITKIEGKTGVTLGDQNIYQIEITGEEKELSYNVEDFWLYIDETAAHDFGTDYNNDYNK